MLSAAKVKTSTRRATGYSGPPALLSVALVLVMLAYSSGAAMAAQSGSGTLTDVVNAFKSTSGGWIGTALTYARHLFFALVAIELAWTAITYVLQRDNLSDFVANLILKLMGVFFFLGLLQNAPTWIPAVVDSFSQAGAAISGQNTVLDPSTTFGQGLQLAKAMLTTLNNPAIFTAVLPVLLAVLCSIGVVIAYAVVAGQLFITLIESYIVISAGLFFLGFSGSRWTLPFSERYVGYAVSVGIKLFMLYLIVGLGATLAQQWQALFTPAIVAQPEVYIGVAGSALVFMLLGWQIPSFAGALMTGSPSMTLGTAGNVVATTASAGAGIASGVFAAAGVGAGIAISAAAGTAARFASPVGLEGASANSGHRPVGYIEPAPRNQETAQQAPSDNSALTAPATTAQTVSQGAATYDWTQDSATSGSAFSSSGAAGAESDQVDGATTRDATSESAAPSTQSLEDLIAQHSSKSSTQRTAPSNPLRSAMDAIRGLRIPTLPHDAAGGSIHIRFRHHDGD
jgi:type IV secretion system protein TrbL